MGLFELILLSVGLAMDAFAVSVCKGLSAGRVTLSFTKPVQKLLRIFAGNTHLL